MVVKIKNHLILLWEYIKINIASAMEYRLNFIVQIVSMIINDFIWIIFWWIFFEKFHTVNSWQMNDILMLYAVITVSFGLGGFFFGNKSHLAQLISEGRLDFYLNLPKNELFHTIIGKSSWFAVGDIIFGLILATISFSISQWPLFILLVLISAVIIISFSIITGSLGFYWGSAQETSRNLNMGLISFASYPLSVFGDTARIILLTIIPAGFVGTIPVKLLNNFSLKWFLILVGVAIIILLIAVLVFYKGLKKYESGSMITTRT